MATGALLPVDPWVGQDFYVPAYRILVGEEELRATHDILSITYSDSLTAIDSCDLTVNNWDPTGPRFKYSGDDATFLPWSQLELHMGYYERGRDQRQRMLTGEITTMAPNFPSAGGSTLTVRGLNVLHRFRLKQETKSFFNKTDTEIAQFLVGRIDEELRKQFPRLRLKIDPDDVSRNRSLPEAPLEFLVMNNQYPIVFLMERARRIGYELTIVERPTRRGAGGAITAGEIIFKFGPTSSVTRPTYVLEWGKSLISFQPTLRVAGQVAKVTVRGWSPQRRRPIEKTVTRTDLRGQGVVSPRDLDLVEPALAQEITVDRPVASEPEARQLALMILRQQASELVVGKGKTVGLPDLKAGTKLQIRGLGPRFSGPDDRPFQYLVTETSHVMGEGGYTTDFTARMETGAGS